LFIYFQVNMNIPDLSSIITPDDISTKGNGNYAADYVNWAKVAHLLSVHANGWQFRLRECPGGGHVWKAPNETGYLVGYFVSPEGSETPDFPQAIMDNRNAPIQFGKISARDVTDTHRRCLCTTAAFTFGLAYQLWAKEPIENPYRDEKAIAEPAPVKAKPKATKMPSAQTQPAAMPMLISAEQRKRITDYTKAEPPLEKGAIVEVLESYGFSNTAEVTTDKFEKVIADLNELWGDLSQENYNAPE
jgi:Protein of unknown function (DUF1071)